jgi:FHA domain
MVGEQMADAFLEVRRDGGTEMVSLGAVRITLGRSAQSTIAFPEDDSISRSHAVLERQSHDWVVHDVGSSNGTYVNGSRLSDAHVLRPGDEIRLGASRVTYRAADASTTVQPEAAAEKTRMRAVADAPAPSAPAAGGYLDLSEEWRPAAPAPAPPEQRMSPGPAEPPAPSRDRDEAPVPPPMAEKHGSARVRGVARGVQVRRTDNDRDVLAFRVDRYDESGNRLAPVAVEVPFFGRGQVGEGEEVEVSGKWHRGTLRANKVSNLSTGAEVGGRSTAMKIALVLVVVFIVAFFAFIGYSILSAPTVSNPFK